MSRLLLVVAVLMSLLAGGVRADPAFWKGEWPKTDFAVTSIENWAEIRPGGPPKDGIPALSAPEFHKAVAETQIKGPEPVISLQIGKATPRAYPIRYLTWHEIVNDTSGLNV